MNAIYSESGWHVSSCVGKSSWCFMPFSLVFCAVTLSLPLVGRFTSEWHVLSPGKLARTHRLLLLLAHQSVSQSVAFLAMQWKTARSNNFWQFTHSAALPNSAWVGGGSQKYAGYFPTRLLPPSALNGLSINAGLLEGQPLIPPYCPGGS